MTASSGSGSQLKPSGRFVPIALFAGYALVFSVLAISPHDRTVWWAENIPIVAIVGVLVAMWSRGVRFSVLAYAAMSVLIYLHTVGGYYTFERVPFGWVTRLFGFRRNHYDRVAHFSVGFYAYAIMELSLRRGWVTSRTIASALLARPSASNAQRRGSAQAEVRQDLLDRRLLENTRHKPQSPSTAITPQNIESERPLHQFRPLATSLPVCARVLASSIPAHAGLVSLAVSRPPIRHDPCAQLGVSRKDAVIEHGVLVRPRDQCRELREEVERFM